VTLLLAFYAGVAVVSAALGRRLGARTFWVACSAPTTTVLWLVANRDILSQHTPYAAGATWVPELGLEVDVRVDAFSYVFVALVAGVGLLIFAYSRYYFDGRADAGRAAALLVAFAGAMIGIVVADNLLVLYVAWELTSVTSYLLIGLEHDKPAARAAALRAMLVTGAGGLAMLGGFVLIGEAAGSYSLSGILARPPDGSAVAIGLVLVLAGAFTKSAQFPFHAWLPGAMAAPTPISAFLHSATMVKAGVYVIARFSPAFATDHGWWMPVVVTTGVVTMLFGALRAMREHDLKLLLAYGTVSQLGFLVVLFGVGRPEFVLAGVALLVAHALFKAPLFLVVGIVDHQAHTRDVRQLSGVGRRMRATAVVASLAVASMAGLPPLFGFIAKEAAFEAFLHEGGGLVLPFVGVVLASALTFAYGVRFLWGAFADKHEVDLSTSATVTPPASAFLAPVAVLSATSLVLGVAPVLVASALGDATLALAPTAEPMTFALWHGWTSALALSALTWTIGAFAFVRRERVARAAGRLRRGDGAGAYRRSIALLNATADHVTGVVQNGSLPAYLGVILVTMLVLPGAAIVSGAPELDDLKVADSWLQLATALLVAVAAIATARARRRFAAVLLLGSVGFGVAVLFVIQGAPDLALTQLLVETLLLVMFVLVLRFLPSDFRAPAWRPANVARVALAAGVGVFVTVFSLIATGARVGPPISEAYIDEAPNAGGRNVVNVILVDFRALDTLGEITVLTVAALGIASLVLAGRARSEGTRQ
jgi:multicomponent Na+:H+ antiporter subunit A